MARGSVSSWRLGKVPAAAIVGVRPTPRVISGQLSSADAQAVFGWIALNTDALVAYWEGRIDTARVIQASKPLAPAP
jgi:hypothetical protein